MYQLVLAVSLFGTSPAPADEAATPIIGGTVVTTGNWRDTVAVIGAQGTCSGTLVAPDVVVTAGHCAEISPTRVKLDTIDMNGTGGITATVQSITAYPGWETTYDVSVIKLATPITAVPPRKVAAACTFTQGWSTGTSVHLVGYGAIDIQAQGNNSKLYEVSVPLTDPTCASGNGCQTAVSPNGEFTAGGAGRDSCNGDSGGPVYLDTPRGTLLVGAVSRATDSATNPCGDGGIYVRIDKVTQWIETTTGRTLTKDECLTTPPSDPTNPDDGFDGPITGGCSAGGSSGAGFALLFGALLLRRRR